MKQIVFGGLIFIGGAIMLSTYLIDISGITLRIDIIGGISMIIGVILGIVGLFFQEK